MSVNGPWRPSQSALPTPPSSGPPRRLASVPPSSSALVAPSSIPQKHLYRVPYDLHAFQYAKEDALTLPPIDQLGRASSSTVAMPVHKPWASHSPLTPPDDAPLPHQHLPLPLPMSSCASSSSSLSAVSSTFPSGTGTTSAASSDIHPYMSSLAPPTRQHPFASSSSLSAYSSSFHHQYAPQKAPLPSGSSATVPSVYQTQTQSGPRLHSETLHSHSHSQIQVPRQQEQQQPRSAVASDCAYRRASWTPSGAGPRSAYTQDSYGQSSSSPAYAWNAAPSTSTGSGVPTTYSHPYSHQHQRHLASPSPSPSPVQVKVEAEVDEEMDMGLVESEETEEVEEEDEEEEEEEEEEVYGGRYGMVQAHVLSDDDVGIEVEGEGEDDDKENIRVEADPYVYHLPPTQPANDLPTSSYASEDEEEKAKEEEKLTEWVTAASSHRSSHFIAEKMCEMVCYLWFSASLGPEARRRRRERERERAREERESPKRGRTRELRPPSSAHSHGGSTSRPSSSAHAHRTRPGSSHNPHLRTESHSQAPPYSLTTPMTASLQFTASPEFVAFMHRLLATTQVSQSVIVLALHYIYRLKEGNEFSVGRTGSEFRVGVVALMMANKFVDDNTYTNKTWSDVSAIPLVELNKMEREFLLGVNYTLFVDKATYESWLNLLRGLVCAKERECRRWRGEIGRSLNLGLGLSGVMSDGRQMKPLKEHGYGYGMGEREERARSNSPARQRTGGARPTGYGYAYAPAYPFTFSVPAPTAHQQETTQMAVDEQYQGPGNTQMETSPSKHKRSASDAFSPPPPSLLQPIVKVRRPTGLVLDIGAAIASQQQHSQAFQHSARTAYNLHSLQQNHSRPGTGYADSLHRLERMSLATPVDGSGIPQAHSADNSHPSSQGHVLGAPYDPQSAARRAGPAPEKLYFYALAGSPGAQGGVDPEGEAAGLSTVDEEERVRMEERGRKVKAWLRCVEALPPSEMQQAPVQEMAYSHYPVQRPEQHYVQQTSSSAYVYPRPTQDSLPGIAALDLPSTFSNPNQSAYASQPTSVTPTHSHNHYAPIAPASNAPETLSASALAPSVYPHHSHAQPSHLTSHYSAYAAPTVPVSGVPPMASLPLGTQSARTSPYHAPAAIPVSVSAYVHVPAGSTSYAHHTMPSHLHQQSSHHHQHQLLLKGSGAGAGGHAYTYSATSQTHSQVYPSVSVASQAYPQAAVQSQPQPQQTRQGRTRSSSVFANAGPPGVYHAPAPSHAGSAVNVGYAYAGHVHSHPQAGYGSQQGYANIPVRTNHTSELSGALGYR